MARSTKPKKNKQSFWGKLIPRTPKTQLFAFIVAFALIGGGIFLYRSFAGTSTYYVENGNLVWQEGSYKTFWVNPNTGARQRITWLDRIQSPDAKVSPDGQYMTVMESETTGTSRKEILTVRKIDGSQRKVLDSWNGSSGWNDVTWSPDSKKIAYSKTPDPANPVENIYSVGVDGKNKKQITKNTEKSGVGGAGYSNPLYAVDGRLLVGFYSQNGVYDVMIDSNGNQTELPRVNGNGAPAPYSPQIAWTWRDWQAEKSYLTITNLQGFDDPDKKTFETVQTGDGPLWSPDEKSVLVAVDGGNIQQIDVNNGKVIRTIPKGTYGYFPSSWRPVLVPNLFNPTQPVTRQAMAAFLYRVSGKPEVPTAEAVCGTGKPGPFKDVKGDHAFCAEIEWMKTTGLSTGNADGTFNPTQVLTRQAVAAFLYRAAGKPEVPTAAAKCGSGKPGPFKDVPGNHTFCKEIEWMRATGMSTGYGDGTFKPTDSVARQAAAAFLYRLKGQPQLTQPDPLYADVPSNHTFYKAIQWLGEQR